MNKNGSIFKVLVILLIIIFPFYQNVFAQEQEISIQIENIITTEFPRVEAHLSLFDLNRVQLSGIGRDNIAIYENDVLIEAFDFFQEINFDQPLAISLLIDTTGSMAVGSPSPLENVVSAAKNFVMGLQPHDSVGVISFSEEVTIEQTLTTEKAYVINALENLVGMGNTSLYDAIYQGVEMVNNSEKKSVVILITDGIESGTSDKSFQEVIDFAALWKVPVYSIGFGSTIISPGGDVAIGSRLDEISSKTGGFDQIFQDSNNIDQAFNTINQYLRKIYSISYTSDLPESNLEHNLKISLSLLGNVYEASVDFIPNPIDLDIVSPSINSLLSIEMPISARVDSMSKISVVQFLLNDVEIGTLDEPTEGGNIFQLDLDLASYDPGDYEVGVVVTDVSGNKKQASIPVSIREPIKIDFTNPTDGQQLLTVPDIEVMIDSVLEIDSATLYLNDNELATFTESTFTQKWPAHAIERGIYRLTLDVTDNNGNRQYEEITIRIGNPPVESELFSDTGVLESENTSFLTFLLLAFGGGAIFLALLLIVIPVFTRKGKLGKSSGKQQKKGNIKKAVGQQSQENQISTPQALVESQDLGKGLRLQEISGLAPGNTWVLTEGETRFGRKKDDNDIQLKGANASRRMAIIRRVGQDYLLHSLHPENPVFINNQPVAQQMILNQGDQVRMGESLFTVIGK